MRSRAWLGSASTAVEMHAPPAWGSARAATLRSRLDEVGLAPLKYLTGGHGVDVVPSTLAVEGVVLAGKTLEQYALECLVAAQAGFHTMVVFAGPSPSRMGEDDVALTLAGRALVRIARFAEGYGISVLVETHAGSIGHDDLSFRTLRDRAQSANLFANVDPSNYAAVGADVLVRNPVARTTNRRNSR